MKTLIALFSLLTLISAYAGECTPNEALKIGQELGQIQAKLKAYARGPLADLTRNTPNIINDQTPGFLFCDFYRSSVGAINKYTKKVGKLIQDMEAFAQKNGTSELVQKLSEEIEENKKKSVGALSFSGFQTSFPDLAATRASCGTMPQAQMKKIMSQYMNAQSKLSDVRFFTYSATMSGILLDIAEYRINNCQ